MKLAIWEIWSYVQLPLIWFLFKKYGKRNVFGDMLAGTIIGCFLEFATEPLWTYHFKFTLYKDIPPSIIMGWGMLFTLTISFSEFLYKKILRTNAILPYDKKIFVFDVVGAALIALPLEALGLKSGVWDYNYSILNWNWGTIPVIQMPYEALLGYCLLMMIAPTFIRYWQGAFEGTRA